MDIDRELKRGGAEMMILALLDEEPRHGYDLLKTLEERSGGVLRFHIGSVYPILYRLEKRDWIAAQSGGGRRRIYAITAAGRCALESQRGAWREIAAAIARVARIRHA